MVTHSDPHCTGSVQDDGLRVRVLRPPGRVLEPDDGEVGSLSLWGGSFAGVVGALPSTACSGENSLTVGLAPAADTMHLMWAADISQGAAKRDAPLRLTVQAAGAEELSSEIDPDSVRPAQP